MTAPAANAPPSSTTRRWLWPTSLRARLTLWYTAILTVPLILFALVSYAIVARTLEQRTDVFIGDALTAFSRELTAERRAAWPIDEAMRRTVAEVQFQALHIAILGENGTVVAMGPVIDDDVDAARTRRPSAEVEARLLALLRTQDLRAERAITVEDARGRFRVVTRPFPVEGQRFTLTGTYSLTDITAVLTRLRELFQVAIPALLLAAAVGGFALARRSLRPVAAMATQAAAISASTMHERLPVTGGDELVGLATVINALLDRLESTFERQRRFIADASHELRTPTAVVRTEADITLARATRPEAEYRESVTVMRDAAQRLTRIVDDLFLLTRADAGHLVARQEPVDLEAVVHAAARAVQPVAHARGVKVLLDAVVDAPVCGDADLLGRLFLNLLDNAVKYGPVGGRVTVTMTRTGTQCVVQVEDTGPGIPLDAQTRVFERFVRLDTARSRSETSTSSGAGLGLAIARRIAEVHGGTLGIATSQPGRTVFAVHLPVTPEDNAPVTGRG